MTLVLSTLFTDVELGILHEAAAALEFRDGARTAGRLARAVKANEQAMDSAACRAVLAKVETALRNHPVFMSAARPKAFVRLLVSRYQTGQTYGTHVDDALMGGKRTDLSFTLFLSNPNDYEGGALVIEDRLEDRAIRLSAGEAVLYPSTSLHRVDPVRSGTRLAVVGWITSFIRDPAQREILMDLDEAIIATEARNGDPTQLARLARTRSNLLRMWAD